MSEQFSSDRRRLLIAAAASIAASGFAGNVKAQQASASLAPLEQIDAGLLRVGYADVGPAQGPPVVLLHGWPGGRSDYRRVAPLLADVADVVVPDLRGFGESDKHLVAPDDGYTAVAQARSVLGLLDELDLGPVVLGGYDIGSRIAQTIAQQSPDRVRALVVTPPAPGAGQRLLAARLTCEGDGLLRFAGLAPASGG